MSASTRVERRGAPTRSSVVFARPAGDARVLAGSMDRKPLRPKPKPLADHQGAVKKLAALAQETRLAAFRLIIAAGEAGCSAGVLADSLGIPATTLSFHLASLVHAGLASQQRVGRQIIYAPIVESLNSLIAYMMENCCGAEPCEPACGDAQGSSGSANGQVACKPKECENAPRPAKARKRAG